MQIVWEYAHFRHTINWTDRGLSHSPLLSSRASLLRRDSGPFTQQLVGAHDVLLLRVDCSGQIWPGFVCAAMNWLKGASVFQTNEYKGRIRALFHWFYTWRSCYSSWKGSILPVKKENSGGGFQSKIQTPVSSLQSRVKYLKWGALHWNL